MHVMIELKDGYVEFSDLIASSVSFAAFEFCPSSDSMTFTTSGVAKNESLYFVEVRSKPFCNLLLKILFDRKLFIETALFENANELFQLIDIIST